MKAWWVQERKLDWGIVVHGDTREKAKFRASRVWPDWGFYWPLVRVTRMSPLDDKPATQENVRGLVYNPEDEDGEFTAECPWINVCDCPICLGEKESGE